MVLGGKLLMPELLLCNYRTPPDQFSTLTDDEVCVLFCFLCSDSALPDFNDRNWVVIFNLIRRKMHHKENLVTSDKPQRAMKRLDLQNFLWEDKARKRLTKEAQDETMYSVSKSSVSFIYTLFYLSSFHTAQKYLRSQKYCRKPGEKCLIGDSVLCDSLLIHRLQMNILTHVTMEDMAIFEKVVQILAIPLNVVLGTEIKRTNFFEKLKKNEKGLHHRRSHDSEQHVKWPWRFEGDARPDIVRSCIGLQSHWDTYIIDNKAYRKPSEHHTSNARILLYCLLLVDEYTTDDKDNTYKTLLSIIKNRYFEKDTVCYDISTANLPKEIIQNVGGEVKFTSEDVRHNVMYAFVTECLMEDSDLEFFLTTASRDVISEYCRSWYYTKSEGERCLYVPQIPKMYELFIGKLQLDIITHCTVSDRSIHDSVSKSVGVPKQVLRWNWESRKRYVEYAKRGIQTVHHARGMIVGCAGAGKTTLLNRLLSRSEQKIKRVKYAEGLEHGQSKEEIQNMTATDDFELQEKIFEIHDRKLEVKDYDYVKKKQTRDRNSGTKENVNKTLSFFDFGGQCAYYACHQIYLTRRAFYIVVVDASKHMDQEIDQNRRDKVDTLFTGWTYKDYFQFWLKSIHTYCSEQNARDVDVMIVVTHWENSISKNKNDFMQTLINALPRHSNLGQYIRKDSLFYTEFPKEHLPNLEKFIVSLAESEKFSKKIPPEWKFLYNEIENERVAKHILSFKTVSERMPVKEEYKMESTKHMLQYYHDAGKVLFFDEKGLNDSVIIDVQWFVYAFKSIITDANRVRGIDAFNSEWEEYYATGILQCDLLSHIWKMEDKKLLNSFKEECKEIEKDNPCFLFPHKQVLLKFMQRLGLISTGESILYVHCMNNRPFGKQQKYIIKNSPLRSSVLVFLFDFLPFFLFHRLVLKLMDIESFNVLKNNGISCLYKNAALFIHKNHHIALAMTPTTIQLQVYQHDSDFKLSKEVILSVRNKIEDVMNDIARTFHKQLSYRIGYICDKEEDQILGEEITHNFVDETKLEAGENMTCPNHQMENRHAINPKYMRAYWK